MKKNCEKIRKGKKSKGKLRKLKIVAENEGF